MTTDTYLEANQAGDLDAMLKLPSPQTVTPGEAAGIEVHELATSPPAAVAVRVTCIDYCPEQIQTEEVSDLADFIGRHRPAWSHVRWINVAGLTDLRVIHRLAEKYNLHPLAIEDVLSDHRPKFEDYPEGDSQLPRLFTVAWILGEEGRRLHHRQVGMFLGRQTLLTFQPAGPDGFDTIRQRLQAKGSRLRQSDASFLFYSLLDAMTDHYFPLLERYSQRLEKLQRVVLDQPTKQTMGRMHRIRHELILVRRSAWAMRDLIQQLHREAHPCLAESTRLYFRDVYDHIIHVIDFIETYREFLSALTETYVSSVSNRLNDIMKVLAVISTIFVPLTFLAGVYGMNMPIPENEQPWMYPVFWGACLLVGVTMLVLFRRRGWL